jgi:hypothetical protein
MVPNFSGLQLQGGRLSRDPRSHFKAIGRDGHGAAMRAAVPDKRELNRDMKATTKLHDKLKREAKVAWHNLGKREMAGSCYQQQLISILLLRETKPSSRRLLF